MELISVRELFKNTDKYAGTEIEVGGWVRNRRPSKQFGFIVLNDGTYFTPFRWCITILSRIFRRLVKSISALP